MALSTRCQSYCLVQSLRLLGQRSGLMGRRCVLRQLLVEVFTGDERVIANKSIVALLGLRRSACSCRHLDDLALVRADELKEVLDLVLGCVAAFHS